MIDIATIQNFESLSNDGSLLVQVSNIGTLTATFYVGVVNCTNSIDTIAAVEISLGVYESKQITFKVYTTTTLTSVHACVVYLRNSLGELIQTKTVDFNTTSTETTNNQDTGTQKTQDGEETVSSDSSSSSDCDALCPSWYNVLCFLVHVLDNLPHNT